MKPVISDIRCRECGLYWCKNFQYRTDGSRRHNGYYHRCKASGSGKFDGRGPFVRVGLDMKPNGWTDKTGCETRISANHTPRDSRFGSGKDTADDGFQVAV